MSKIKNSGLDHYGAKLFEQQQCGLAGVEEVEAYLPSVTLHHLQGWKLTKMSVRILVPFRPSCSLASAFLLRSPSFPLYPIAV